MLEHFQKDYHPIVESKTINLDDEEVQINQEISIVKDILCYLNKVIDVMNDKKALYGTPDSYTPDMMAIKAYTKCGLLYNSYHGMSDEKRLRSLYDIGAYNIILIEYFDGAVWNDINYIGAKYISTINHLYQSKRNTYNRNYKTEDNLTPEEITSLILMKAIRIKNILRNTHEYRKAKEALIDNAKDILAFCYVLYNKIKNKKQDDWYMSI